MARGAGRLKSAQNNIRFIDGWSEGAIDTITVNAFFSLTTTTIAATAMEGIELEVDTSTTHVVLALVEPLGALRKQVLGTGVAGRCDRKAREVVLDVDTEATEVCVAFDFFAVLYGIGKSTIATPLESVVTPLTLTVILTGRQHNEGWK